ncbi:hypothetical protein BB560_006279 [Smittium megazygosporum]|uniref:DUF202 domain-containing protein n=1 Tax=Smittium megazygosporum TaxID=133381 RepID=A0A2T9YBK6_9FUNG|nr:hypothetical protein BB560_006279 [Smittium megazygosporum]
MIEVQKSNSPGAQEEFYKSKVKGYLANERTFIRWMQFSVTISSIGIALLNFGYTKQNSH